MIEKIYKGVNKIEICLKCGRKFRPLSSNKICCNCVNPHNNLSKNALEKLKDYKREKRRI